MTTQDVSNPEGQMMTETLKLAKSVLDEWAEKYGEWSNSGPQMERAMDRRLPPANHIRALEDIDEALAMLRLKP